MRKTLSELQANPEWSKAVLAGSGPQVKELNSLVERKHSGDKLDEIIAGTATPPDFETVIGLPVSAKVNGWLGLEGEAGDLRPHLLMQ